jgi:heterodisulfide reductase subunit A
VAVVHCVGSLDERHRDYCSGVCCLEAFKLNRVVAHRWPGAAVTHFYRALAVSGKDEAGLFRRAASDPTTRLVPFTSIDEIAVGGKPGGKPTVAFRGSAQEYDLVVLMPAVVPSQTAKDVAGVLGIPLDRRGFFEELHDRVDATATKVRGIHVAGTCQAPGDLGRAMTQGLSAAGSALAALVPGRRLELEPMHAEVDAARCSGCRRCGGVCPYKAIRYLDEGVAEVDPALCAGCGTCAAACPAAAMSGLHFTDRQIYAEIEGVLS